MASRFLRQLPKREEPTQAEVRRAQGFWSDVLQDAIVAQIDDSSAGHAKAGEIVEFAADVADAALAAMEKRWPKL